MSKIIESADTLSTITKKEESTTKGWGALLEDTQQFFLNLSTHNIITAQALPPNGLKILLHQTGASFHQSYIQNFINRAGIICIVQARTDVFLFRGFLQPTGSRLGKVGLF